ncbi:hypothetical protein NCS57_00437100 [Fusarium keratoplasticum]|uniref:Uncharacterized protein n=1 Tax=Fusarium keratoplasticum TaxID=1328300 RepID=A0ACC0R8E4_9HYPO|nr:hypothetical protein NCS57_00437100 [Fusarium keratoplasticum]KAI8675360.1 hypothetical protein NCS57_00437100 [Fusarium keratoplasticum]
MTSCNNCHRREPDVKLLTCRSCFSAQYCSKECQRSDWPKHRGPCRSINPVPPIPNASQSSWASWLQGLLGEEINGAYGPSPPKGLDSAISEPFTRLQNGTFLHDRSERDVYRILIDSFRFRLEEQCQHEGKPAKGTIYEDHDDSLPDFKRYLETAASRNNLLPPWWTPEKQRECEAFGMSGTNFQDLHMALEQFSVTCQYGDSRFPSQLRMLAEAVYGKGVGGTSSFTRRSALAQLEAERR